jgi:phosphoribosylformylglycinamidine synthase PurS subunit
MEARMPKVDVVVLPKEEVLDPQGLALLRALHSLGFMEVKECRVGKVVRLDVEGSLERVEEMAKALLANPVTEDFSIVVKGGEKG